MPDTNNEAPGGTDLKKPGTTGTSAGTTEEILRKVEPTLSPDTSSEPTKPIKK